MSLVAARGALLPARRARPRARMLQSLSAHALLLLGVVVFGFPFFWMVTTAFKNGPETIGVPPQLLPGELRWVNFSLAISYAGLWTGLRNFLRPFRGVNKWFLGQYVAMFEWAYNIKEVSLDFLRALLGVEPITNLGP